MGIDQLGGKLGDRIAEINTRAKLSTLDRMRPMVTRFGLDMQHEFFRLTGKEVSETIGPLWRRIGEHSDAPDWLRRTGAFIADGKGQWATIFASAATGALISGGLGDAINNELSPITQAMIALDPNTPLSAADGAAALARGIQEDIDYYDEAAKTGVDHQRMRILTRLQQTPLAAEQILELVRRGAIDETLAHQLFHRAGMQADERLLMLQLRRQHISPAEAVAMWNRAVISEAEALDVANLWGLDAQDMRNLLQLGGEPPAIGDLMLAWQRGAINESQFDRGVIQGPLRNEWIPTVKELRWRPLPPTEVADAVNQGHMPRDVATQIASESGIRPEDFAVIVDNAGIPPAPQEALDWLNRGLWTEADFRRAFLESRLKNRYIDMFIKSRERLLPQETARSLLAQGFITEARCAQILTQHGFAEVDVAVMVAEALDNKRKDARTLTVGQMLTLYEDQEISREFLVDFLASEEYDQANIDLLIALADWSRLRRYRDAVVTRIKSGLIKGLLSEADASTAMDRVGVPHERRDTLLALWEQERLTVTRDLTTAQLISAAKKGILDVLTVLSRLVGQGYAQADAEVLLAINGVDLTSPAAP